MAITYEINRYASPTMHRDYTAKRRAPAAKDALWQSVYDMLEANGLRDRPCAYRLRAEVEAAEVSPPPVGHVRSQKFLLNEGDTFGPQVHLFVYRD